MISFFVVLALAGCASEAQRSGVLSPSLDGITAKVGSAQEKVKTVAKQVAPLQAATLNSAVTDLDDAKVQIADKQKAIDDLTASLNKSTDRLNYLEPKYSEAVGLLWKWRFISIGTFFAGIVAGGVLMAIFRLWLKANLPIIGGLIP